MAVRGAIACILLAAVILLAGCGNELRTEEQAGSFIRDLANGESAGGWKLADDATIEAQTAWENRETIHDLGATLREDGPEWGCEIAERVDQAAEVLESGESGISDEERTQIVGQAAAAGVEPFETESVIDEVLELPIFEEIVVVGDICGRAKEL
jgi:hypothetical protein